MIAKAQPKFSLGHILATPGALEALQEAGQTPTEFLKRHARGDWGDVCEQDQEATGNSQTNAHRNPSVSARCSLINGLEASLGSRLG